ncbi:MAG: PIN domain-containing protein [bacterium]|nr:PIN domain-containing protein [bacterium]
MFIFVDTSAWIATLIKKDINHKKASKYFIKLLDQDMGLVTSNYVLCEVYTRLRYDVGHQKTCEFHTIISKATSNGRISIYWVNENIEKEAWEIFEKYKDQKFSMVDCTSFVIAKRLKIKEVFAFDEDFSIMGFINRP